MYGWEREGRSAGRLLSVFLALAGIAGLVFLYLWLNTRIVVLRHRFSEAALELRALETELSGLEFRVEAAFSVEALMEVLGELNREAELRGGRPLEPLEGDRVVVLPADGEGDRD